MIEEGVFYKVIPNVKNWEGIEIIARFREGEFCLASWEKDWEKRVKEAFYKMEQDPMFGIYEDDYKGFSEVWEKGEYEPAGSIVFGKNEVEIIQEYWRKGE